MLPDKPDTLDADMLHISPSDSPDIWLLVGLQAALLLDVVPDAVYGV
jgi:hypothetical protein